MDYGSEYYVKIPIEIYGKDQLLTIMDALKGVSGATQKLSADQREFVKELREEVNAFQNLDKALKSMISGASGASDAHRMMAMGIRALNADLRQTSEMADRASQAFGRIGGRIFGAELLGRAAGIPGGGFIGSQLMYSMGGMMSPALLTGIGVAGAGLVAGYGAYQVSTSTSQYAQQQSNLARQFGGSPQEMQLLGRVAEVTDTQVSSLLGSLKSMNRVLSEGGEESRKTKVALGELGLSAAIAFETPQKQMTDILTALRRVSDETERERMIVRLLGESGRALIPLVNSFDAVADAVRRSGVIIDQDGIERLVRFRQATKELGLEWDALKQKMALGIVAAIDFLFNGNPSGMFNSTGGVLGGVLGGTLGSLAGPWGAAGGAILGGAIGSGAAGSWQSHFGTPEGPGMPTPNITSGFGLTQEDRLRQLDAIKPLGRTTIERFQDEQKDIEDRIKAARDSYIGGGGSIGYTVAGDPAQISNLEKKLDDLRSGLSYADEHGMGAATRSHISQVEGQLNQARRLVPYFRPGTPATLDQIRGLEGQRLAMINKIKYQRQYESQLQSFENLTPADEMTTQMLAGEGRSTSRRFGLLTGLPAYQQRVAVIRGAQTQTVTEGFNSLTDYGFQRMMGGFATEDIAQERDLAQLYSDQLKDAESGERVGMRVQSSMTHQQERESRVGAAYERGFSRYGLTPNQLVRRELQTSLRGIGSEYETRRQGLSGEIEQLQSSALAYGNIPTPEAGRRKDQAEAEISQKMLELKTAESDATTRAIEAINRFNEATEHAAMQMRQEFGAGFASIIMGAQHGRRGFTGAVRGVFEGQEGTLLRNVGEHVFDMPGVRGTLGNIGSHLPDWLSRGTIFGHTNDPIKINTDATEKNTAATNRLSDLLERGVGSGTSSSSAAGGAGGGIGGYSPVGGGGAGTSGGTTGAAEEVAGIAGAAATLAGVTSGSTSAQLSAASGSMSKLASVLKGTQYSGNIGKILSGSLSTSQTIGAVAGTIGLGIGAYEGISTIAQGGARNVAGGLGVALGSIAPFTGVAAPFVGAAAALSGLASAFLPDPRQQRANTIERNIFTQRYEAPTPINMMESSGGTYADYDIYGGVRTSHFSPYPIVSNPYLDVPRRTIVPGHEILGFGGYQDVTGAKTPSVVHIHNWNVHTMDSKSFQDNSTQILNSINKGLNENWHPLLHTMGKALGIR